MVGKEGLEPSRLAARDPKSRLSAGPSHRYMWRWKSIPAAPLAVFLRHPLPQNGLITCRISRFVACIYIVTDCHMVSRDFFTE